MWRRFITTVGVAATLSLACGAQTVDEVIAKNIQAHGGMEKLKAVQSLRTTGKFSQGSFRAAFSQENQRPEKVREETTIQGLTRIDAYDGQTGWRVSPFGGRKDPQLLSEDDLKGLIEDGDIDGQLMDYKAKGHKAELVGHDPVEGTDCYKVKLTLKNGDVRTYYLDTDSYLEIKMESQRMVRGSLEENETYYGDYEAVNGVYYPFAFQTAEKGQPEADRVQYTVEKIEVNAPLGNDRFAMPGAPAAKPAAAKSGAGQ